MKILLVIFFFGLAVSLIVLKGLFMSQQFAAQSKRVRTARDRPTETDTTKDPTSA